MLLIKIQYIYRIEGTEPYCLDHRQHHLGWAADIMVL